MRIKGEQIVPLKTQKKSMVILFNDFMDIVVGKHITGFHSKQIIC